VNINF
jgi:hypothetical protein